MDAPFTNLRTDKAPNTTYGCYFDQRERSYSAVVQDLSQKTFEMTAITDDSNYQR